MKFVLAFILYLFLGIGSLFSQHVKKDGSPDRRYKENRSSASPKVYSHSKPNAKYYPANSGRQKTSESVPRDKHGKIKRSASQKKAFMKSSGFPKGRKGWVVDHIIPLKKGGCDCPSNMQWQTKAEAKEKDKWE